MWKIGVSFESTEPMAQLQQQVVDPVARCVQAVGAGIYSNHLHQETTRTHEGRPIVEHLLIFEVLDFKEGIREVRMAMQQQLESSDMRFHNLNDCRPLY